MNQPTNERRDKLEALANKRVNKLARQFKTLNSLSNPLNRDALTEQDITKIFGFLRQELRQTEKRMKQTKQGFTLRK